MAAAVLVVVTEVLDHVAAAVDMAIHMDIKTQEMLLQILAQVAVGQTIEQEQELAVLEFV